MAYKKIREKRLRMSIVVLNSEHKLITQWLKQTNTTWQQWLHATVECKCAEIKYQKEFERQQKIIAKQEMTGTDME